MAIINKDYDEIWQSESSPVMIEPIYDCVASFLEEEDLEEECKPNSVQFDTNFNEVKEKNFINGRKDSKEFSIWKKPKIKPKPKFDSYSHRLSLPAETFADKLEAKTNALDELLRKPRTLQSCKSSPSCGNYSNVDFFNSLGLDENMKPRKSLSSSGIFEETTKFSSQEPVVVSGKNSSKSQLYTKVNKKTKKAQKYRVSKDDMCDKLRSESNLARLTKQLARPFSTISFSSSKRRGSLGDLLSEPWNR